MTELQVQSAMQKVKEQGQLPASRMKVNISNLKTWILNNTWETTQMLYLNGASIQWNKPGFKQLSV